MDGWAGVSANDLPVRNLVRNLVRNRRLAKAIADGGWSRLRRWVEYYDKLHGSSGGGVLSDGSPCPAWVRKSLSMCTHSCPRGGRLLQRDHHAAAVILKRGLAVARAEARWPRSTREMRDTVGPTGT